MRLLSALGGLPRIPKKRIGTPSVFALTSRTSFAYGTLQSPECCPRPHRHAPESTKIALLPSVLPYPKSGTLTRPVYLAVRVSAGVSRKSVHLFRWRSYFHKAFTGTKITPSRERLPNLFIQRGGIAMPAPRQLHPTEQRLGPQGIGIGFTLTPQIPYYAFPAPAGRSTTAVSPQR